MKRIFSLALILIILVALTACSNSADHSKHLKKEGIAPYSLSEGEKYVLQAFGMDGNSQIISYKAPKEAISLDVNVYKLEGESWSNVGGTGISIGEDRQIAEQLIGTFTMQLKENFAIGFNINASGRISFKTDEITVDNEPVISTRSFLQEFAKIEINKEIPIALMIYDSGMSMESYSLNDYFEPSKFDGMDLVQIVTLAFCDKEN